ncbi:MAG: CapA family protein [Bacilli bacterium]|nr:CapA family protein [Bacilli bacterium]
MKKRRKKLKKNNILLFLLALILIPISITSVFQYFKSESGNSLELNIIETPEEKIYEASLIMVGDALVHNSLYNDANRLANYDGYDFKPHLKLIKEEVSNYDIAYYNQETILGGTSVGLSSYPSFNSPQELGDAMIDAGFNLVSLATNHTLDRGEKAVKLSREYWNKQEGVHAVGSYLSYEEKETLETKILEVNNITYAMLNYTYGTNGIPVPSGKEYLVNLWNDTYNYEGYKEKVKSDILAMRDKVDILIVAMHWGREYTHKPTDLEIKTAKFLAGLDVDIIIGTHPHVIQPVEWIDDTLVFYSLGNFISAQTSSSCSNYKCNIGLMSSMTIKKTIKEGDTKIEINNINNNLIYTYHKNYTNFLVIPFSNPKIKEYLVNYEDVFNQYSGIIETDDESIKLVPLAK